MDGISKSQCSVCGSREFSNIAQEIYQQKRYLIAKCQSCTALFTSYREGDSNCDYGVFNEGEFKRKYLPILQGKRLHDRESNYLEEVSIINRFISSGRLLDIGCHAGWLLGYLQKKTSLDLYGLEPSLPLAQLAGERLGIKIYQDVVRNGVLEKDWFDFICLTDVLEHLATPNDALQVLADALRTGGKILIKVPTGDFAIWKYRLRKVLPFRITSEEVFDAKEHHVLYNHKSLRRLLIQNGFSIKLLMIPRPVQTAASNKLVRWAREIVYFLARKGIFPSQDILVIAEKVVV
jgi:SAM-dependent methyltransferase